jgi:hypothetical protein
MLKPPVQNINRALWRAALEAAAGFTPVTAALSRIYQVTFPAKFEQDLTEWRQEVSTAVNDHEGRLTALEVKRPTLALTDDAMALASWLSLQSESGLEDPVEYEAMAAAFPEASARDLQDAAAELEMHGLATVSKAMGYPLLRIIPSYALYALFDPVVHETSPQSDAVEIAKAALELDSGHAPELETRLGWPRRRFNPAFALLLTLVADGRVRKVIQPDYPSLGFMMAAEERVWFKALIRSATPPD